MTDPQMITIGLATIVLLAGILFNNARIGDVHARLTDSNNVMSTRLGDLTETLRAEIRADRAESKSEIAIYRAETNARFDRLEAKIDSLLKLMADMDARLTKLEERG